LLYHKERKESELERGALNTGGRGLLSFSKKRGFGSKIGAALRAKTKRPALLREERRM